MQKMLIEFTYKINDRDYRIQCEHHSPICDVKEFAYRLIKDVGLIEDQQKIQAEQAKLAEEAKKSEEKKEELKPA
jgi:hypothetical protein